jgi:hypothetical protein
VASSPQSYQKRQRELRKKERKAEKQAIRHGRSAAKKEAADEGPDEDALLEEFRLLNESHAAGEVEAADFEYRKAELFHQMGLGPAPEPREDADEDAVAEATDPAAEAAGA